MNGFLDATRFPEIKELCIKAELKQFKNAKHLDSGLGPALDKRPKLCFSFLISYLVIFPRGIGKKMSLRYKTSTTKVLYSQTYIEIVNC